MKLSSTLLTIGNCLVMFTAMIALASSDADAMGVALVFAFFVAMASGVSLIRRPNATASPANSREPTFEDNDAMKAYEVLNIDERLEALERAERERALGISREGHLEFEIDDELDPPRPQRRRTRVRS